MLLHGESHSTDGEFSDQDIGNFGVQEKGGLKYTPTKFPTLHHAEFCIQIAVLISPT